MFKKYHKALKLIGTKEYRDAKTSLEYVTKQYDEFFSAGKQFTPTPSGRIIGLLAYKNLGHVYVKLEKPVDAINAYLAATEMDSSDLSVWFHIYQLSMGFQNSEEGVCLPKLAVYAFERMLSLKPNDEIYLTKLIELLFVVGDEITCNDYITNCLQLYPNYKRGLALKCLIEGKDDPISPFDMRFRNCRNSRMKLSEARKVVEDLFALRQKIRKIAKKDADIERLNMEKQTCLTLKRLSWTNLAEILVRCHKKDVEKDRVFARRISLTYSFEFETPVSTPTPSERVFLITGDSQSQPETEKQRNERIEGNPVLKKIMQLVVKVCDEQAFQMLNSIIAQRSKEKNNKTQPLPSIVRKREPSVQEKEEVGCWLEREDVKENNGIVDLMKKFVVSVFQSACKWDNEMSIAVTRVLSVLREHKNSTPFSRAYSLSCAELYYSIFKCSISKEKNLLSLSKKYLEEFLEAYPFVLFMSHKDSMENPNLSINPHFAVRFYWLQGNMLLSRDKENANLFFETCKSLIEEREEIELAHSFVCNGRISHEKILQVTSQSEQLNETQRVEEQVKKKEFMKVIEDNFDSFFTSFNPNGEGKEKYQNICVNKTTPFTEKESFIFYELYKCFFAEQLYLASLVCLDKIFEDKLCAERKFKPTQAHFTEINTCLDSGKEDLMLHGKQILDDFKCKFCQIITENSNSKHSKFRVSTWCVFMKLLHLTEVDNVEITKLYSLVSTHFSKEHISTSEQKPFSKMYLLHLSLMNQEERKRVSEATKINIEHEILNFCKPKQETPRRPQNKRVKRNSEKKDQENAIIFVAFLSNFNGNSEEESEDKSEKEKQELTGKIEKSDQAEKDGKKEKTEKLMEEETKKTLESFFEKFKDAVDTSNIQNFLSVENAAQTIEPLTKGKSKEMKRNCSLFSFSKN